MALYTVDRGDNSDLRPALVLMHFLGGSGREWDEVVALLGPAYRTITIDLPGFGGSASETGYGVEEMADAVHEVLAGLHSYVLVGHSMSGKLALLLARREVLLPAKAIAGLVLVAPSPPSPEPMGEEKRSMMLGLLGEHHDDDATRARNYITKNELRDIRPAVVERATAEVLRMNRTAWVAWVQHGSKEDWSERVGVLGLPAVLVAGEDDLSLGPKQQRETTMTHLGNARMVTVKGCSHLVPMERPEAMASILREFVDTLPRTTVPPDYLAFIEGERVSVRTREVLLDRMAGVVRPQGLFTAMQERTLRAVMKRVVPGTGIDLTRIVMARLATGKGDGWRYDALPTDVTAYRNGLDCLAEHGFEDLDDAHQDRVLQTIAAQKTSAEALWFEELRGEAATAYVAHPQTMARIGFSGPGVGGALTPYRGFVELGVNSPEAWEPQPEQVAR